MMNSGSVIAKGGTGTRHICCAGSGWGGDGTVRTIKVYNGGEENVSGDCGMSHGIVTSSIPVNLCSSGVSYDN